MADSKGASGRPRPASASSPDRTARRLKRRVGEPRASAPSSDAPVVDEIDAVGSDGPPGESAIGPGQSGFNILAPTASQPPAARQPLVSLLHPGQIRNRTTGAAILSLRLACRRRSTE